MNEDKVISLALLDDLEADLAHGVPFTDTKGNVWVYGRIVNPPKRRALAAKAKP